MSPCVWRPGGPPEGARGRPLPQPPMRPWPSPGPAPAPAPAAAAFGKEQFGWDVQANTGNYVVLPSAGGRAFMARWAAAAETYPRLNDQQGFNRLRNVTASQSHAYCWLPRQCEAARAKAEADRNNTGVIRLYAMSYTTHFPSTCLLYNPLKEQGLVLDPCHWTSELQAV
jgi:hypothetical protein